jgi:DNA-binding transcriptional ArsR family regulator
MQTAVTTTSIRAYHEGRQDGTLGKSAERVARLILSRTEEGKPSWIAQIARDLDLDRSSVSGRLSDLKKAKVIALDDTLYKLVQSGTGTDMVSGRRCDTWDLVLVHPLKPGVQTAMF